MTNLLRIAAPLTLALSLSGCALLGGGPKPPPTLLALTPEAASPGEFARSAPAGQAVTVSVPVIPRELRTPRVPARVGPSDVAYVRNLQWVDTPDRLFKDLLAETIRRTTNRVVLDPRQAALDPGLVVTGHLHDFGFVEAEQAVLVRFDASLSTPGGTHVQIRRFEARAPADGTAPTVGPALNRAANQVAMEVARWIGS